MTFPDLWNTLCRKRPALADPEVTVEFTTGALRRLLEQVYVKGVEAERESKTSNILDSLLRGMGK